MTEELMEKMIGTLAGLRTELFGIKNALIILIIIAVCAVFLTIIAIWRDR